MPPRRPLTEGVQQIGSADPETVRRFVSQQPQTAKAEAEPELAVVPEQTQESGETNGAQAHAASEERQPQPRRSGPGRVALVPVTVRLRPEIANALKRASLERQLSGDELHTQQDIVEQALEPWLRQEGML